MNYCPGCGRKVEGGMNFCPQCGWLLERKEAAEKDSGEKTAKYVTSCEELSDMTRILMDLEARNAISDYISEKNVLALDNEPEFKGIYTLLAKNPIIWGNGQYTYLVYAANVTELDGDFRHLPVFFAVCLEGCVEHGDGNQNFDCENVYLMGGNGKIMYNKKHANLSYLKAYDSAEHMYDILIKSMEDKYISSVSKGLKQYMK